VREVIEKGIAPHLDLKAAQILALLFEDRDDVDGRASGDAEQEKLDRPPPGALAGSLGRCVHDDAVAFGIPADELAVLRPTRAYDVHPDVLSEVKMLWLPPR
jgi:hypothetical protein